ncbi:MAG: aminopeptidase Y [Candidatus Hepatoplasma scabrum]|nr:MAG: aminopeptidase Y [Candidatus Hepatoplasma sp.]
MKINEPELKKLINNKNVWFKNPDDVYYLTSFKSTNLNLFYINKNWYAVTDDRYYEQAKNKLKGINIFNANLLPFKNIIIPEILKTGIKLSVDDEFLTLKEFDYLRKNYPLLKLKSESLIYMRMIKNKEEIELVKKAVFVTDQIYKKFLKYVKVGKTEKDLKQRLHKLLIEYRDCEFAFDPIIAAGKNSSNPHIEPTNYTIKKGDLITIDFGVSYNGYKSDMTRTILVGNNIAKMQKRIFELVKYALDKVIEIMKPGIEIKELDHLVRKIFQDEGYDKYFIHALGHGIGLNIHEAPVISGYSNLILKEGMIIAIEPGIYLPNEFGVRLEQDILITKNGHQILNHSPIDLKI